MLGNRKSLFSQENEHVQHKVFNQKDSDEFYKCMILDICGAHKPKSRFLPDETFDFGVYIVVACYDLEKIFSVVWSESYEELRNFGIDDNIVGRKCYLICKSAKDIDLKNGKIKFLTTRLNAYQAEANNTFVSFGGFYDCLGNHNMQFRSYNSNSSEGTGETWMKVK